MSKITKISIHHEFISEQYIELFAKEFYSSLQVVSDPKICIYAECQIKEIDILLISYFILFNSISPGLEIIIDLDPLLQSENDDLLFKLRQYMAYAYLVTGNSIFEIRYRDNRTEKININSQKPIPHKWLFLSEKFLPIFFINEINYKTLFQDKISVSQELDNRIDYDVSNKILYDGLNKLIIQNIKYSADNSGITELAKLAFYRSLFQAKILNLYFDNEYASKKIRNKLIRSSNLQSNSYDYYESIKNIFEELVDKPIIYTFIYSNLLSSELLPGELNNSNLPSFRNSLFNLWEFTKELVYGLQELSKNILEHSSNKIGVITGKIYNKSIFEELKLNITDANDSLKSYISSLEVTKGNDNLSFFDINIVDIGEIGVIQTLLETTKESIDIEDEYSKIANEDIVLIEQGKIRFKHFVVPDNEIMLNQQAKRATAHLGLLTFSKLVQSNSGMIRASTWEIDFPRGKREVVIIPDSIESSNLVPFGTNFNVVLPIDLNKKYYPHLKHQIASPSESIASEIQVFENLFRFRVIKVNDMQSDNDEEIAYHYLLDIEPSNVNLVTRETSNDFWTEFKRGLNSIEFNNKVDNDNSIVCLNLDKILINGSELFRFLGKWELHYPSRPILLYNLSTEKVFELIRINEHYCEKNPSKFPYWNNNSFVLLYSFVDIDKMRFYFADALWGSTKEAFLKINMIISKTNFNATSSLKENHLINFSEFSIENHENLNTFNVFHNENTLLPFDLLLCNKDNVSLFEQNAMVLLQNELKPE